MKARNLEQHIQESLFVPFEFRTGLREIMAFTTFANDKDRSFRKFHDREMSAQEATYSDVIGSQIAGTQLELLA